MISSLLVFLLSCFDVYLFQIENDCYISCLNNFVITPDKLWIDDVFTEFSSGTASALGVDSCTACSSGKYADTGSATCSTCLDG